MNIFYPQSKINNLFIHNCIKSFILYVINHNSNKLNITSIFHLQSNINNLFTSNIFTYQLNINKSSIFGIIINSAT